MKEITFKQKKVNHFYAIRNDKGQLEVIQEPHLGQKVFEVQVVAGG